ncbi:hypothetical protein DFA_07276 [Cavenderia fasciculata]|uniref:Uncharacterized protein n=1 Tax=Cavenderia fasciculata TaxID=261658 RepID=F4PVZ2_CACFS|nr:uncharacterized protein DFA_07276 [Cavenderia fasciculata]EGG20156.1 hypothetical protein DFA_07276 [Cavenderia fasciculata]|eukprot:XP_004367139.1 hypothetical protein DFA_07276 [Cavenderia fasciculata]
MIKIIILFCLFSMIFGSPTIADEQQVVPKSIYIYRSGVFGPATEVTFGIEQHLANGQRISDDLYYQLLNALKNEFQSIPDGANYRPETPITDQHEFSAHSYQPTKKFNWSQAAKKRPHLLILLEELVERYGVLA